MGVLNLSPDLLSQGPIAVHFGGGQPRVVQETPEGRKFIESGEKYVSLGEQRKRLGDRIGDALASVGVTPERWQKLKEEIGLPPGCNCPERKEWINKVDEALGLAEKVEWFKKLIGWRE